MSIHRVINLPYYANSCVYFEAICAFPRPIFLDSCQPFIQAGRYDILSAAPYAYLTTDGALTTIETPFEIIQSHEDPFNLVKAQLSKHQAFSSHLPFNGGALGYFAYDLNKRLEVLPDQTIHDINLPQMAVGIYLWGVVVDHLEKKTYLLMPPEEKLPENWENIYTQLTSSLRAERRSNPGFDANSSAEPGLLRLSARNDGGYVPNDGGGKITSNLTFEQYAEKFQHIMHHIHQGDAYQINFAQRWQLAFNENPWDFYQLLREKNPAPLSAFIPLDQGAILSCSPERFLTVHDRIVTTMPIKGTAPRDCDPIKDQKSAQDLLASEKNRAENTMIVDLMRNDLNKSCITGSVHVPIWCELHSFVNVHHLVSTVRGQLRADKHPLDLLRDCFPGGSITGAPKIRAMEIIDTYEPHQRHIYCGSIGYINFNGEMDTNIAIRTAVLSNQQLYFWAGGGIVKDSIVTQEYQETLDKIKPFFEILHHS